MKHRLIYGVGLSIAVAGIFVTLASDFGQGALSAQLGHLTYPLLTSSFLLLGIGLLTEKIEKNN